jgi:monoamine oxidase
MAQGSVIKCMAVYRRPFWREQGLSGEATSDRGPVRVVFDNSPPR